MVAPTKMDDLRAAWRALAGGGEGEGWKTISIDSASPCPLLAGRRQPHDEEAMLVGFRNVRMVPESQLPQGHGFEVSRLISDPTGGNRKWLALARRAGGGIELFEMMAEDLIRHLEGEATQNEDRLLYQFLSRIRAWQDFMDRHREGVLTPEAELGLFGELVVVELMVEAGMPANAVLHAWTGPLESAQDFMPGSGGIEVKTTLATGAFPATITSLEQLDDSLRRPLFVAAIRVTLNLSGITLPAMAEKLRDRLSESQVALALFEVRLIQAGLLPNSTTHYTRRFTHVATFIFPVGDSFPRLTRANIHPAIRKARYEIDLDLAKVSDIGLSRALESLGAI